MSGKPKSGEIEATNTALDTIDYLRKKRGDEPMSQACRGVAGYHIMGFIINAVVQDEDEFIQWADNLQFGESKS